MAIQKLDSKLSTAANNIVSIGSRSNNSLVKSQKDYSQFVNFLDLKINELEAIKLPSQKKVKELSNIDVTNSLGNSGGLLRSLLSGALDLAGLIRGKETPGKGGVKPGTPAGKPKLSGNKLKLGGIKAIGIANAVFAGLDFATGLAEGESVGKAAAGAGGALAGSLLGGAIGQALIPVPGLGFVIGSAVGNFIGGYTADRIVDSTSAKNKGNNSLRSELDVKIQKEREAQKSEIESESSKSFKRSVDTFSSMVDKFGTFFGISSDMGPPYEKKGDGELEYANEEERDLGKEMPGDFQELTAEGGILPSTTLYSTYGWRKGRHHAGNDYAIGTGTPISVIQPGLVTRAGWFDGYGYGVQVNHPGGINSFYGHLSKINVKEGQNVEPGTVIGLVGSTGRSTGPHVHFEIDANGQSKVDPTNYADKYFRFGGNVKVKPKAKPSPAPSTAPSAPQAEQKPKPTSTQDPIAESMGVLLRALERPKSKPKPKLIPEKSQIPLLSPREIRKRGGPAAVMAASGEVPSVKDIIDRSARIPDTSRISKPTKAPTSTVKAQDNISNIVKSEISKPLSIEEYPEYNRVQSTTTIIDRPVTTTVLVGGGNKSSSKPMIIPMNSGGGNVVINTGPTANQLRDSIAEFILLSSIG